MIEHKLKYIKADLYLQLKKELIFENEQVLYNNVIYIKSTGLYSKSTAAYYFIIIKSTVVIISLDSNLKIIRKRIVKIDDIIYAGRAGINNCILIPEEQIIKLDKTTIHLDPTHLRQEDKIITLIRTLRSLGISDVIDEKYSLNILLRLFLYFILSMLSINFFIKMVK